MAEPVSGLRALKAITFLATAPAILDVARLFEDVEITFGSEHVLSRELAALEQATTAAGYRFTDALVGTQRHFLEDGLILRTERGDLVRSKSELVIADKLFARGIDYGYEQPLELEGGRIRYPDFTITDHARGVTLLSGAPWAPRRSPGSGSLAEKARGIP